MNKEIDSYKQNEKFKDIKIIDQYVIHSKNKTAFDNMHIITLLFFGILFEIDVLLGDPYNFSIQLSVILVLVLCSKVWYGKFIEDEKLDVFKIRTHHMNWTALREFEKQWIILKELSENMFIAIPNPDYDDPYSNSETNEKTGVEKTSYEKEVLLPVDNYPLITGIININKTEGEQRCVVTKIVSGKLKDGTVIPLDMRIVVENYRWVWSGGEVDVYVTKTSGEWVHIVDTLSGYINERDQTTSMTSKNGLIVSVVYDGYIVSKEEARFPQMFWEIKENRPNVDLSKREM